MVRVLTIVDLPMVMGIVSHADVKPFLVDTGFSENFLEESTKVVLTHPSFICFSDGEHCFFVAQRRSPILWEVHDVVAPSGRGKLGFDCAKECITFMFQCTPCLKLVGYTPVNNRRARMFALKVGFKVEGMLTNSWLQDGQLYDQVITGISKKDWKF